MNDTIEAHRASPTSRAAADAFRRRRAAGLALVDETEAIARACYDMAGRFHQGGKLIAFGNGGSSTDAQHIAVEFVHPVIVGKRALPSVSLTNDIATLTGLVSREGWDEGFAYQIRYLARPQDIAVGISPDGRCQNVLRGLEVARELGLLTIVLAGEAPGAITMSDISDHTLVVATEDPRLVKEMQVTIYHIVWELVHVFLEQPGGLGPGVVR